MARKRIFTLLRIVSVVTALGLLGAPYGGSLGWASNYESRGVRLTGQQQHMERRSPTATQTTSATLLEQSPRTLDEYAAYVQEPAASGGDEATTARLCGSQTHHR